VQTEERGDQHRCLDQKSDPFAAPAPVPHVVDGFDHAEELPHVPGVAAADKVLHEPDTCCWGGDHAGRVRLAGADGYGEDHDAQVDGDAPDAVDEFAGGGE